MSHQALRCFRKKRPTSVLSLCLITGTQYTHCFPLPGRPALLPGIFCSTVIYHSASQTKCSLVCSFLPLFGAPPSSAHGFLGHPPPLHMASWGTSTPAYDLLGAPYPCIWPTWGTPTPVNDLLGAPPIHLHGLLGAPPPYTSWPLGLCSSVRTQPWVTMVKSNLPPNIMSFLLALFITIAHYGHLCLDLPP